jgi:hypothetical protein
MSNIDRHIDDELPENALPVLEIRIYRNGNPPTTIQVESMDEARTMLALLNEQEGTRAEFVTEAPWRVEDAREHDLPEDELELADDFYDHETSKAIRD